MMNFFIQMDNFVLPISKSLASLIHEEVGKTVHHNKNTQNKQCRVIFRKKAFLSLARLIPSTSPNHFYVSIYNKKYRITRELFTYMNGGVRETKKDLDKFYTKYQAAELCVKIFQKQIKVAKDDLIIEPSAGNGSFLQLLKAVGSDTFFIDIAPENDQIQQINFLD